MKVTSTPSPHADLLDGLRSLGLAFVTAADVGAVVKWLYRMVACFHLAGMAIAYNKSESGKHQTLALLRV